MTAVIEYTYEQGQCAANRALDRTGLGADDLIQQHYEAEGLALSQGRYDKAEYHKGFADTVHDYIQERSDR